MAEPYPFEQPVAVQAPTNPPIKYRHPLGLPAGSVRAVIILMILGTVCTLLIMSKERAIYVPLYLYYLLFLTVGAYFSGRANAPSPKVSHEKAPLYLPRGTIRWLVVIGFAGVVGFALFRNHELLKMTLFPEGQKPPTLLVPMVLIGAFFLGYVVARVSQMLLMGPGGMPAWYQDVQAWVSLLAVLGLGAQVLLELVVFPNVENPPDLPHLQVILCGIIAFYFGARA